VAGSNIRTDRGIDIQWDIRVAALSYTMQSNNSMATEGRATHTNYCDL